MTLPVSVDERIGNRFVAGGDSVEAVEAWRGWTRRRVYQR